ncbi:MAG: hypothetical protein OXE53_10150 [Deltaproteobacteria bacterium]|nr:hypothetical protein [Deltaproteobacteria bacterium]
MPDWGRFEGRPLPLFSPAHAGHIGALAFGTGPGHGPRHRADAPPRFFHWHRDMARPSVFNAMPRGNLPTPVRLAASGDIAPLVLSGSLRFSPATPPMSASPARASPDTGLRIIIVAGGVADAHLVGAAKKVGRIIARAMQFGNAGKP